jgi:DNA-binding CsgD family transcriptional regulator
MDADQPVQPQRLPIDEFPRRYTDAPTFVDDQGYVWEWCPTHPRSTRGTVLQHRLVKEVEVGRFLTKQERVHHDNERRWDNRPSNLLLHKNHSEHMKEHWQSKGSNDPALIDLVRRAGLYRSLRHSIQASATTILKIRKEHGIQWPRVHRYEGAAKLTEESVREALQGRSTKQAAELLRCHPMTLYNRFGHLLNKRTTPNFLDDHQEDVLRLWMKERLNFLEIAQRYSISESIVSKSIRRWTKPDAKPGEPGSLLLHLQTTRPRARYRQYRAAQLLKPAWVQPV